MFAVFIISGFSFATCCNNPVGWSEEVIITARYGPCCGRGFRSRANPKRFRFDILYSNVSENTRRILNAITGIVLIVAYVASLPAAYRYVSFMKVERSAYLHVPSTGCIRSSSFLGRLHRALLLSRLHRAFRSAPARRKPILPRSETDLGSHPVYDLHRHDRHPGHVSACRSATP